MDDVYDCNLWNVRQDYIYNLCDYAEKRYPEKMKKGLSVKEKQQKILEYAISKDILSKLLDKLNSEPDEVLSDMLLYYNMMLSKVRKDNYKQRNVYGTYIQILTVFKKFIEKEMKV